MTSPHFDLANHPPADTIKMLTDLLQRITSENDLQAKGASHPPRNSAYMAFHARSIPTIEVQSYLARILKYCPCKNECFLSLLVYFDRMSRNTSGLRIDSYNIHRLLISGIMIASKFFSDVFFTNTRYAKVGGLPVSELNALELEFLQLNDYSLNVSVEELQKYGDRLLMHWLREETQRHHADPSRSCRAEPDHRQRRLSDHTNYTALERTSKSRPPPVERLASSTGLFELPHQRHSWHHRLATPPYSPKDTIASSH